MVSVVIPCYNVADYISEAIESVLAQTLPVEAIICVDDGSEDDTLTILQGWHGRYPEQVHIVAGPHKNASAARNTGFAKVATPWVQFLDADDLLMPDKIAHQVKIGTNNDAELVVGAYAKRKLSGQESMSVPHEGDPWVGLAYTQMGITSSNLWRTEKLHTVRGWNEDLLSSQEYDLMFRLLQAGANVAVDNTSYTIIRERESGSISQTRRADNWHRYIDLRQRMLEHLTHTHALTDNRRQAILQSMFNAIRSLYAHDPQAGLKLHKSLIPNNYKPPTSWYSRVYSLLGFQATEFFFSRLSSAH